MMLLLFSLANCSSFGMPQRPMFAPQFIFKYLCKGTECYRDIRWSRSFCGRSEAFDCKDPNEKKNVAGGHRWNSIRRSGPEDMKRTQRDESRISSLLVCGDGDLSYSASIAPSLAYHGISLIATVLEAEEIHRRVYKKSRKNAVEILLNGHQVRFGVDATDLVSVFPLPGDKFDRIQFNFPHWTGKSNTKYNRRLLAEILKSASELISTLYGEIHVALAEGQGGSSASTLEEWRTSWLAAQSGAEHGLVLADLSPFTAVYDRSSHRGVDRTFSVGSRPELYKFMKAVNGKAPIEPPKNLQLCCRHELHVKLPRHVADDSSISRVDVVQGDFIQNIIQSIVPTGVTVEVPLRDVLDHRETGFSCDIAVFLIVYRGARRPMTRKEGDYFRSRTEEEVGKFLRLRENRVGRMVSRPFPYQILQVMMDDLEIKKESRG